MTSLRKIAAVAFVYLACLSVAPAYSLLGPFTAWQIPQLGYAYGGEIGGPMNLGEEYRLNVKTVYYGIDESFINYFGSKGTNAIDGAFAILNALPAASKMSTNLSEFPLDTLRRNNTAAALNLFDVKTVVLSELLEFMGLAGPERYTWTLRDRVTGTGFTNYTVIKRNFDPVTFSPSSYVNGVLYTYLIIDPLLPSVADAIEVQVDPLQFGFGSVAGLVHGNNLDVGQYVTGLTRDDVGGLRYLYRTNNYQFETLVDGVFSAGTSGSPWSPPVTGTNLASSNLVVNLAVRPGVDKITFQKGKYDSLIGFFIAVTNVYADRYVTNSKIASQNVARIIATPDIVIAAEDIYPTTLTLRGDPDTWINNDAINGQATLDGPGVVTPDFFITLSKLGPFWINENPGFLDEIRSFEGIIWGSFDGTTNAPTVYPDGTSIQDIELQVLSGGSGGQSSPWTIPNSFSTNSVDTTGGTN